MRRPHAPRRPVTGRHRWLTVPCLLIIFAVGFYLRIAGYTWGIEDGHYYHPDERGIFMQADSIWPVPVPREEGESFWHHAYRWLDVNLGRKRASNSDRTLEPPGFNYGSLPWYFLNYCRVHVVPPLNASLIRLEDLLNPDVSVDLEGLSWPRRLAAGSVRLLGNSPIGSPLLWLARFASREVPDNPMDIYQAGRIGRFISALLGAFTLLLIYAFGARFYNWKVGLLAAFLLMVTVTHIQLSHFYCFDPIQAFFIFAALYSMARIARSGSVWWYILSALFIGLSIATKFSSLPIIAVLVPAHALLVSSRRPRAVPSYQRQRFWVALTVFTVPLTLVFLLFIQLSLIPWLQDHRWILGIVLLLCSFSGVLWFAAVCFQVHLWNTGVRWAPAVNPWVFFLLALWLTSRFSFVFQPFAFISPEHFWRNITEQRVMATGLDTMPYTIQYRQTYAYFYHLGTMFHRTLGYPLAITCFAGVIYLVWRQFRRPDKASIILLAWVLGFFLVVGRFNVKFARYMIPIIPPLVLIGAKFLADLLDGEAARTLARRFARLPGEAFAGGERWVRSARWAGAALLIVTATYTWAYAFAFVRIYKEPHTWKEASYWIYENVPSGSSLVWERWGDPLPMAYHRDPDRPPVDPGRFRYRRDDVYWYATDSPEKIADNMRKISQADYIVLCSKRAYGSTLRAPERFPYTGNYYKMLFSGQLGFEPVKIVERPIRFLGLTLYDDLIDESFRLYDHPKVCIFKKVRKLDAPTLTRLVTQPPSWAGNLNLRDILTVHDGEAVYQQKPRYPVFSWYLALLALGLVAFPFLFAVCPNLSDRGYALSKTLGILTVGYFAWLVPSLRITTFNGTEIVLVFTVIAVLALLAYARQRKTMGAFLEANFGDLILTEVVFLLVFFAFTRIRMWNPDIHWGEKPMDFSMLTAVYRTDWFPPGDPWIAGKPINYYYYGFVLLGILGKIAGVPPEYCFNLALGTIPALVFVSAYGIARTLTRRRLFGLLGGYLLCCAGSVAGFLFPLRNFHGTWEAVRRGGVDLPWWDRLIARVPDGAVGDSLSWMADFIRLLLLPFKILWLAATGAGVPVYRELGFDAYFWPITRMIPSTVANEFPYWTFLFADLHAHMIVIPFSMLFVGLCTSAVLSRRAGFQSWGLGWRPVLAAFFASLALGSTLCINSWSFPTLAFLLLAVLSYRGWHFRSTGTMGNLRRPLNLRRRLGIPTDTGRRAFVWLYGILAEVAFPAFVILFSAVMLYVPFHNMFYPRVPLGPESVNLMRSGWTTPKQFVAVFGLFAFVTLVYLLAKLRDFSITASGRRRWRPWAAMAGVIVVVLFCAQSLTWYLEPAPTDPIRSFSQEYDYPVGIRTGWVYRGDLEAARRRTPEMETALETESAGWWRALSDYPRHLLLGERKGPYYGLASLVLPWLLLVVALLFRRRNPPEEHAFLMFLAVALSVLIGVEIFYIYEDPWREPDHRWNTVFKFYMHVWIYFSLAAPGVLFYFSRRARPVTSGCICRSLKAVARAGFYAAIAVLLLMSFAFTVFAAYTVTAGPGARCVRSPERPTLDGLSFLKHDSVDPTGDEYRAVHWVRRFVPGQPTLLEGDCQTPPGITYDNSYPAARVSTYTGIPGLLGWAHHAKERGPARFLAEHRREIDQLRLLDQKAVFRTPDKVKTLELLRRWQVDLLFVGVLERRKYPGVREKFGRYGDALDLLFESGNVSIFHTRANLNAAFMAEIEAVTAEAPVSGANAFEAGPGTDPGYFNEPHGLAVDPRGRIIIADTRNHRVQVFDSSGVFVAILGTESGTEDGYREPHDVATDSEGNIYVADTWNSRVKKLSPDGKLLRTIGGQQAPNFYGPRAIAVDSAAGRVYVADTGHHTVQVFDLGLQRIASFGTRGQNEGQMNEPTGVAVTPGGDVVVAEMLNARVSVFDRSGRFLRTLAPPLGRDNSGNEMHVAVSRQGHIYLTDPQGGRIFHFGPGGALAEIINTRTMPDFNAQTPTGIAVDPDGFVLVTDRGGDTVVRSPRPYP